MSKDNDDEMRTEYTRTDLGKGVRGRYYSDYTSSHNIVRLDPEVAEAFPTETAVNDALLALVRIAKATVKENDTSSGSTE